MLIFAKGGKPEKNPRSKGENQQQTQLAYDAESGNRTRGHSGERRALILCWYIVSIANDGFQYLQDEVDRHLKLIKSARKIQ
jgi:hypothetical protein